MMCIGTRSCDVVWKDFLLEMDVNSQSTGNHFLDLSS
jgi:hypothetical protein